MLLFAIRKRLTEPEVLFPGACERRHFTEALFAIVSQQSFL
jgi:hypothetical protein